jgi:opacity protein-like surface antigen
MNKFLFFIILITSFSLSGYASPPKKKADIGFFAGTSSYMGEINPDRLFYKPSISFGGMFRWRLNDTYALRGHVYYGQFSGSDRDFTNSYQQLRNASFSSSLLDFCAIGEYNFFPLRYDVRKKAITPFLFVGFGYNLILSSSANIGNHFNIPFGVGAKYSLTRKITIGAEWSFRKLLADNADGVHNPGGNEYKTTFSNNDWYSFAGIFISFGLFGNQSDCPVYK